MKIEKSDILKKILFRTENQSLSIINCGYVDYFSKSGEYVSISGEWYKVSTIIVLDYVN